MKYVLTVEMFFRMYVYCLYLDINVKVKKRQRFFFSTARYYFILDTQNTAFFGTDLGRFFIAQNSN